MGVWVALVFSAIVYCMSQAVVLPPLPSDAILDGDKLLAAVRTLALVGLFSSLVYLYIERLLSRPKIYEHLINAISSKTGDSLQVALDRLTESLIKAAGEGRLRPVFQHSEAFAVRFLEVGGVDADAAESGDDQLKALIRRYREGDIDGAIEALRPIKDNSPRHMDEYLSMLCCSVSPRWMQEARKLIATHGRAHHYNALAYSEWRNGSIPEAVRLAEQGLSRFTGGGDTDVRAALQNSLAYYYADALALEHAEKALELSREALESRRADSADTGLSYGDTLDTCGYVKIQFGKDAASVEEGLQNCTDAFTKYGTERTLYQKHSQRGALRLAELRSRP